MKEKIGAALERAAVEDASHITVDVREDSIMLSGKVRTWVEREDADRAVRSIPGIMQVYNYIKVKPPVVA